MKTYVKTWYRASYDTRFVGARALSVTKHTHLDVLLVAEREREGERERI